MNLKKIFIFCILSIIFSELSAQNIVTQDFTQDLPQFHTNPLKIPMILAGNFAELRKNHFHGGIDIKTNQKEGYNIYAVGEGYISRINIKGSGYGNAIYIDHPNGYSTVYGHLKSFSPKITEFIQAKQIQQQESLIEYYPEPNELMVSEGETIALSGNTGGSSGPHLHFEVRETQTERPMNPFLFGFAVGDTSKPIIAQLYSIPIAGVVNGSSNLSRIEPGKTYSASGKVGFGVKTYDRHNAAPNNNGVYAIKQYVDDSLTFSYKAYRFSFDHNRYIYSLTDYPAYAKYRSWIYKTYKDEGSLLEMYDYLKDDGIINIQEGKKYTVSIEVEDFKGNKNTRTFYLSGKAGDIAIKNYTVPYDTATIIEKGNVIVNFPAYTFAEKENINLENSGGKITLGSSIVAPMRYFQLGMKPDFEIAPEDSTKYYFKAQTNYGKWEDFEYPAHLKDSYLTANVRTLGIFELKKDTGKPVISVKNIKNGGNYPKSGVARFSVYDNETDIKNFNFYLDDIWVIGVYDKKYKSVSLDFDQENISKGKHQLKLIVTDECNNQNQYEAQITIY